MSKVFCRNWGRGKGVSRNPGLFVQPAFSCGKEYYILRKRDLFWPNVCSRKHKFSILMLCQQTISKLRRERERQRGTPLGPISITNTRLRLLYLLKACSDILFCDQSRTSGSKRVYPTLSLIRAMLLQTAVSRNNYRTFQIQPCRISHFYPQDLNFLFRNFH